MLNTLSTCTNGTEFYGSTKQLMSVFTCSWSDVLNKMIMSDHDLRKN